MAIETNQIFPEQELRPEPKFDAILVHGYWMSEPVSGDVRSALRTRLATRSAALAYDRGDGARNIVLPLGKLWGQDYESLGNLMADELEFKYGVPPGTIIREGNAFSTGGEIKTFLEIAQKNGWTKLLDIAFSAHFLTIPHVFDAYSKDDGKITVQFRSVEEIIESEDYELVSGLVKRLGKSRYGIAHKVYERGKQIVTKIHGTDYDSLEERNKMARTKKGKEFPISFDVYKI